MLFQDDMGLLMSVVDPEPRLLAAFALINL